MSEKIKTISIISSELQEKSDTMFPSPPNIITKSSQVAIDKLKENLSDFVKVLDEIVQLLPESSTAFDVDTLTFSLSLDGSGKISLIGEVSAGFTSGITITLKRK